MLGRNKALLEVNGQTLLDRLIGLLAPLMSEILLVTRQPELYGQRPIRVVQDIYEVRSSLTGIHAGLSYVRADYAFVVPCDTPLLKPAVVQLLMDEIMPDVDIVVPIINGYYEPLCAIYGKACLGRIETQLEGGNFKIKNIFKDLRVKTVPEERFETVDPGLRSFMNVNTPEELTALKALMAEGDDVK